MDVAVDAPNDLPRPIETVMPDRLARRPRDDRRALPIPAFAADLTLVGRTGYNFSAVDRRVIALLASRRRCYVCGEDIPITEDVYFLGDEQSYQQARYPETLGHADCMLAALTACPYIANAAHKRATEKRLGHAQILEDPEKPVVWVLAGSRYYQHKEKANPRTGQAAGLYPKRLRNPRYFTYLDGTLVEVTLEQANAALVDSGLDPILSTSA